jgi:hypothetical protein
MPGQASNVEKSFKTAANIVTKVSDVAGLLAFIFYLPTFSSSYQTY